MPDKKPQSRPEKADGPMRIARFLAAAGIGSRRNCEKLITERRVEVNGETVTEPFCNIDPTTDEVRLDSQNIFLPPLYHLLLYKPRGVTCSTSDPHAEKLITDLLPAEFGRLFPAGRLDRDSEGLIICTNDGAFTQLIAHPRNGLKKTYRVKVKGEISPQNLKKLQEGIVSKGEHLRPAKVRLLTVHSRNKPVTELEFVLGEGKNREIRRLCQSINKSVLSLIRIGIGPIRDSILKPGQWRYITVYEKNMISETGISSD